MVRGEKVPHTPDGQIDRREWKRIMFDPDYEKACAHSPESFTVEGSKGLMCGRCLRILVY